MDPSDAFLTGPNAVGPANSNCSGVLINDEYHFGQQGRIADCGNEIASNDTHIIIRSSIQGVAGVKIGPITRQRRLEVELECAFQRVIRVSSSGAILTSRLQIVADLGETIGNFDVQMGVFKDDTFSTHITADEVISIPEPIYVKNTLESASDNFKLRLKTCWATSSDLSLEIFENGEESFSSFRLNSFEFQSASTVFLHCELNICDSR